MATGRHAEALAECEALARLDADDTIMARFMHLDILLTLRRFEAARALCDRHADEPFSGWDYFRALVEFAAGGDSAASRRLLTEAIEANPYVPGLMLSGEQIDRDLSLVTVGEEDEAALIVRDSRAMWLDVPGALTWLRGRVDAGHEQAPRATRAPTPAALDALASLPLADGEEWQMHLARERGEGWSLHVVSGHDGRMIAIETTPTKPRADDMWNVLSTAMRFPREGEPRRPAAIVMKSGVFPAAWARRFERLGIRQEVRDTLAALDRALADVDERIAAAEQARAEEAGADFDPAAVAAELAGLPREPGMTDDLQRGLYAAAAEFYRSRPWRKLPSDTSLDINGPDGRLVHVVVMGQSGVQQGLAIYEDRKTLAAALRGDEKAAARSTSLAVMFGEAFEISALDHDAIEQQGFEIAGPEAWPLVIRLEPGFAARPPLVWEVELITACLREVVGRVARGGDRR